MNLLPKISITIPNLNNGKFLEKTLTSIIYQNYRNTEILVIDGGSTDNSIDIINNYSKYIFYWITEPDKGQTAAINKGFKKSTGDIVGWMNSDDIYNEGVFYKLANYYNKYPDYDVYYADKAHIDAKDNITYIQRYHKYNLLSFSNDKIAICNQSCFWKINVFNKIGFLDESIDFAMDYEYFLRMGILGLKFIHFPEIWGCQRYHSATKTANQDWNIVRAKEKSLIIAKYNLKANVVLKIYIKSKKLMYHIKNLHIKYLFKSILNKYV